MNRNLLQLALPFLALVFGTMQGCTNDTSVQEPDLIGTDTGNSVAKSYLTLFVEGAEETPSGDFDTLNAWLGIERITLKDCDIGNQTASFIGPYAVDLSKLNELGTVEASEDSVCEALIEVRAIEEEEVGLVGPLHGLSLFASGVNIHGVVFEIRSREALSVDLPLTPMDLQPGSNDVALQIAAASWLEGIDLEAADQEEGMIFIDDAHNQSFLELVHQNFLQTIGMNHPRGGFVRRHQW